MSDNGSCLKKLVVSVALFWSKSNRSRFYLKSAIFKQARKVTKYLECVCKKTLLQKALKIAPKVTVIPLGRWMSFIFVGTETFTLKIFDLYFIGIPLKSSILSLSLSKLVSMLCWTLKFG